MAIVGIISVDQELRLSSISHWKMCRKRLGVYNLPAFLASLPGSYFGFS